MRILVVDDDRRICGIVKRGLLEEGYAVDIAYDGEEGECLAETDVYDLIILDIMMPLKDGIKVCENLRSKRINTPILMLTAKDAVGDRVKGLDAGADDYLVKPFAFNELLARIRALLRREEISKSPILQVGDLVLDTVAREVRRGQRTIELTKKEYAILEYFMRHPNMVITRTMLQERTWDYEFDSLSNLIDVYICRLRRKIDNNEEKSMLQTFRGAGYRLRAP